MLNDFYNVEFESCDEIRNEKELLAASYVICRYCIFTTN